MRYLISSLVLSLAVVSTAVADRPAPEQFRERIPMEEPMPVATAVERCGWGTRLSTGLPVHFFKDESTEAMPGLYLDVFPCETPINLRVGMEGIHMSLKQDGADYYAEWFDKNTKISYYRIPLSFEYAANVADNTTFYLGGGPDLIRTANDLSDFTVGGHLSGRLGYEFTNRVSLAVEAGYQWGRVEADGGPKMNLDGAYVTPTVGYRF
jgi:hypothetical protein